MSDPLPSNVNLDEMTAPGLYLLPSPTTGFLESIVRTYELGNYRICDYENSEGVKKTWHRELPDGLWIEVVK